MAGGICNSAPRNRTLLPFAAGIAQCALSSPPFANKKRAPKGALFLFTSIERLFGYNHFFSDALSFVSY